MRYTSMMPSESPSDFKAVVGRFDYPVLVVSTVVGRGMYSLGEAVVERLSESQGLHSEVFHIPIEELVSPDVIREDLKRYKWISNHFPILLNVVYRIPF